MIIYNLVFLKLDLCKNGVTHIQSKYVNLVSSTSVDCGPAIAPQRGSTNYTNTTEGSLVFYSCDPGLVPEGRMNATCTDSGWSPNPTGLNCTEGDPCEVEVFIVVRPCLLGLYQEYIKQYLIL